jgi:RNA polymerase sigma-70 factor (ECF subfamily)
VLETDEPIRALLTGELDPREAVESGRVRITRDPKLFERFVGAFHFDPIAATRSRRSSREKPRQNDEFRAPRASTLVTMASVAPSTLREHELLEAARAGDEDAFRLLVEPRRSELHAHCYRMLGSVQDAEDAVQETLLRAWRALASFEGRSSPRTWLYTIATNICLDLLQSRTRRVLPTAYGPATTVPAQQVAPPLVETVWVEPYPDEALELPDGYAAPEARYEQREAIELAFIVALQQLPALQRAVLILREVLGFSAREVSETLETSVAAVNSALQRARKAINAHLPERSQQATLRALPEGRARELVQAYADAWARTDIAALRSLLAEEVVFSMPPWAEWWRGRDRLLRLAEDAAGLCPQARGFPVSANGQVAFAFYSLDDETGRFKAQSIDVIALRGEQISEITAFVSPEGFVHFGLPAELES